MFFWLKKSAFRAVAVFVLSLGVIFVAGCSNDSLGKEWGKTADTGFVSGDGSVFEILPEKRAAAPVFSGVDEYGATISSADFLGQVTVVNFWYAGCAPCRIEAPDLVTVAEQTADDGVRFLGVNTRDDSAQAVQFAKEYGVKYSSIMDVVGDRSVQRAFAGSAPLNAVPTTLVLDAQGRVAARIVGQLQAKSILASLIATVSAETGL